MTALAAVLSFGDRAADAQALAAVLQAQAARGPDGERHLVDGPVALGERLLHPNAVPLPQWPLARQTIARLDRFILIWDGRLDNRGELICALRGVGENLPREVAEDDRQLLLHIWRAFGAEVLPRLLGDFALAIWDTEARELVLARDAMGARPLYYTMQPGFFALASEDEALVCLRGVSPEPNFERIAYGLYPAFLDFDWSVSWLAQVRILMPGTALRVRADGVHRLWTWWQWLPPEMSRFASDDEALEAFDALVVQSVRDRTGDLDAIGLITSGGMDTATVAIGASRVRAGRPLRFFATVQDDSSQCIESRAIEALAQTLEAELIDQRVPSMRGPISADDVAAFFAHPHPVDDSIALIGMMCLAAQRRGQRVLLHGASGDAGFFAPGDTLLRTARERGWRAAWQEARLRQRHHTYEQGRSPLQQLARAMYTDLIPPLGKAFWRRWRRWSRGRAHNGVREAGEIGRLIGLAERMQAASLRDDRAAWLSPRLVHEHLQALFPIGVLRGLEGYERVAGRYGVQLRDPLADRRLVSFCLALPLHWRDRDGWTKYIARRWASAVLPQACVWRSDKIHLGYLLGFATRTPDLGERAKRSNVPGLRSAASAVGMFRAQMEGARSHFPGDADAAAEAAAGLLAWMDRLSTLGPGGDAVQTPSPAGGGWLR